MVIRKGRRFGVRALLGLPAGELSHRDVPGDLLLGRLAAELHDRVHSAPTWPARFAAIDAVLLSSLSTVDVRPEVAHAWAALDASHGGIRIADLAAEIGFSGRHMDTLLWRETGLSPKAAARVFRFDRARRLLSSGAPIAAVAAACGYADQPHLTREFTGLAGCPPSTWLAEEFRIVQDTDEEPLAELVA